MSTSSLFIETTGGSPAASTENEGWAVYYTRPHSLALRDQLGRAMTPATHRKVLPRQDSSRRVLRRLKGFLVEARGRECKRVLRKRKCETLISLGVLRIRVWLR